MNETTHVAANQGANASLEAAKVKLNFWQKLPFLTGTLGGCFMWTVITNLLTFFWTDVAMIPTAVVSAFLMITKLWDAINDPIIGHLSDHTQTKWGRYRPWILSFIPVTLFGILTFTILPGASGLAQCVFSLAAYFFYVLAFTAMEVPGQSLLAVVTTDPKSRGSCVTFRMAGSYSASLLGIIF